MDAIVEVIGRHKYFVQFNEQSFTVIAASPAEAYKIAAAEISRKERPMHPMNRYMFGRS